MFWLRLLIPNEGLLSFIHLINTRQPVSFPERVVGPVSRCKNLMEKVGA